MNNIINKNTVIPQSRFFISAKMFDGLKNLTIVELCPTHSSFFTFFNNPSCLGLIKKFLEK